MRDTTKLSPFEFRSLLRGDMDLSKLPAALASQIRAIWARMERQQDRTMKRETKHAAFATAGLNGTRAVARRLRQIEAGQLYPIAPVST
jgi:phage gp16-like protein